MQLICHGSSDISRPLQTMVANTDCQVRTFAQHGFSRLVAENPHFESIFTILITIYVAILGFRMMMGRGPQFIDVPLIALKIGTVIALSFQWPLFQSLVFDVSANGGHWIQGLIQSNVVGVEDSPLQNAEKIHSLLNRSADLYEIQARSNPALQSTTETSISTRLRGAARLELMSTAGLQAMSLLLIGVLTVVGPAFLLMAIFDQTRGLFFGWLRLLVVSAMLPLFSGLGIMIMTAVSAPNLALLEQAIMPGPHSVQIAETIITTVQLFSFAQMAMAAGVLYIVGSMDFRRIVRSAPANISEPVKIALHEPVHGRIEWLASQMRDHSASEGRLGPDAGHTARRIAAIELSDPPYLGEFPNAPHAQSSRRLLPSRTVTPRDQR